MENKIPKEILSYLKKRADEKYLNWNPLNLYKTVVVIPSIKEFENISNLVQSLSQNDEKALLNTLFLFVINNSEDSGEDIKENNARSIELIKELQQTYSQLNIDYIDAASDGKALPTKYAGVGLARKTGMDQALLCFDYSQKGICIVCVDADCEVDKNYLTEIQKCYDNDYKTAVVKYRHKLDNDAIVNYEIFLRYYVLGLQYASSPYAYHSIGSCITMDPIVYAKIGGMNKNKAGEDFYFLEKAAKLTEVKSIESTTVYPAARKSWRVPFGTGQRITRFYDKVKDEYFLYNPKTYVLFNEFLKIYFDKYVDAETILVRSKAISVYVHEFLIQNKFEESYNRIKENAKTDGQLYHQKKIWFDGFKTMKFIHYLRDNGFPEVEMFVALNEIFELLKVNDFKPHTESSLPPIEKQKEYLEKLRELT